MLRRIRLRITAWCYGLFMYEVFLGPAKLNRLLRHAFRIYNLITTAQGVYITDMKKLVFKAVGIGLMLFTFAACVEEDDFPVIESEITMESEEDFMALPRIGGKYQVDIQTESDATWKAYIDDVLGYVANADTLGTGTKTITFYTTTNRYDEDRTANLCITFPGNEKSNITIQMKQLGLFSDPLNADELETSNIIYAVGYGYNTQDRWAHPGSIKAQILRTDELINKVIVPTPVEINAEADLVTGSSITELSNKLSSSAHIEGSGWGFKGEIGASFEMEDIQTNQYEYAIAYITVATTSVTTTEPVLTLAKKEYMTPEAYHNINGLNMFGERSDENCNYPSTPAGFDRLINGYGTHMVNKARLGGKVKYAMRMDVKDIEGSYDLDAFAKMSYDGMVKADGSVTDELKSSYKENSSHIHTSISILGGSRDAAMAISNMYKTDELDKYFKDWMDSLKDSKNLALVDFEASDALIPLYALVDYEKYPQRYNDMKEYMKKVQQEAIQEANNEYATGVTTELNGLPTFDGSSEKNSLIKDVYNNGQWVGRICSEFIPAINKKERVTIIYPVISDYEGSHVKYNMGFYVGDSGHKPAKVCLKDDKIIVTEYKDETIGTKETIYLRGSSISSTTYESAVPATVEDATYAAQGKDGGEYNYPLVKIFDKIWMRENYQGQEFGYLEPSYESFWSNLAHHNYIELPEPTLGPWRIPIETDFLSIKEMLSNYGVTGISTAKAFFSDADGGILGFHNICAGRVKVMDSNCQSIPPEYDGNDESGYYMCWPWGGFQIGKQGYFSYDDTHKTHAEGSGFVYYIYDPYAYPLRLVQDIER